MQQTSTKGIQKKAWMVRGRKCDPLRIVQENEITPINKMKVKVGGKLEKYLELAWEQKNCGMWKRQWYQS